MNLPRRGSSGIPEFNDVFRQQARFVWRVLLRLGVQRRDVPDAGQEVFLVVHRRLREFDMNRSSITSWLYGICLRVASEYRRRHPSRRESGPEALEDMVANAQPEAEVATRRAWQQLASVLDGIDSAKREVFVLYELEQLAMPEVAALVGCPLQTAYSRLHAARRLVFEAFGQKVAP